jgi:transposase-like protein
MTCHNCCIQMVKAGFYGAHKVQRWKCQQCNKRFSEPQTKPFGADVRLPVKLSAIAEFLGDWDVLDTGMLLIFLCFEVIRTRGSGIHKT